MTENQLEALYKAASMASFNRQSYLARVLFQLAEENLPKVAKKIQESVNYERNLCIAKGIN